MLGSVQSASDILHEQWCDLEEDSASWTLLKFKMSVLKKTLSDTWKDMAHKEISDDFHFGNMFPVYYKLIALALYSPEI